MGLGRDGTLHGTFESRLCLFPLGRPVSRKACKAKKKKKNYIVGFVRCCLGLDSNFKSLVLAFCFRFLAVIMWIKQKKNAP